MSLTVVVQETALRALARIRSQDRDAFLAIRSAMMALADDPRPAEAVPWGGSGIFRWHLPGIRTLYEIDPESSTIYIINIARTAV
jgi:mRNA-degrading endonuclease RelE of RelBE toxin-antitoxin system